MKPFRSSTGSKYVSGHIEVLPEEKYWKNPKYKIPYKDDGYPDFQNYMLFAELNNIKSLEDVKDLLADDECIKLFGSRLEDYFKTQIAKSLIESLLQEKTNVNQALSILDEAKSMIFQRTLK